MDDPLQQIFNHFLYELPASVHGGRILPQWMEDGNRFWYAEETEHGLVYYQVDPPNNLRQVLPEPPIGVQAPQNSSPYSAPQTFSWITGGDVPEIASPDGQSFLGTKNDNLYLRSAVDGTMRFLTSDGTPELAWDAMGAHWSADGKRLAARKINVAAVESIPILYYLESPQRVETIRWTRAGQPMWENELYVIEIADPQPHRIDLGSAPIDYLNIVGLLPDAVVFAIIDRRYRTLNLLAAGFSGGAPQLILHEEQPNFHNYEIFGPLPVTLLADGEHFLWISERDGWSQIYLYHISGKLVRQLTHGPCPVYRVIQVDTHAGWVYFEALADPERLYDLHLCRVRLDGSDFQRLTHEPGSHEVQISPSLQYFLDTHSSVSRPPACVLRTASGELLQVLSQTEIAPLLETGWQPPEEFWVTAADGITPLRGVLYQPGKLDPGRKYPVIEYIYGGPHTLDAPNSFYGAAHLEALAQTGFVVFVVDGRGTLGRGKAFQDHCYGQIGQFEIPEHAHVLLQLAEKHPYMDLERVGIFGLSHGGYLTLRALLTHPQIYKVGVATCPVPDLLDFAWAFIERFMGLPQDRPEAYAASGCIALAEELQGKLLIIHGTRDMNAPIRVTMKLIEVLVQAGRPVDMLVLPEQLHLFSGAASRYWLDAIRRYFQANL